ncbi:MAG: shikimate kinase [Saprospiraceae bacterium]
MTVFLVGMPGCGKTTIGKLLAKRLNMAFLDTDQVIEEIYNIRIPLIFELFGEATFRKMEDDLMQGFNENTIVVATGGGLPCHNSLVHNLKSKGTTIFIERNLENIALDIHENHQRPLIQTTDFNTTLKAIQAIYNQRISCYSQAHFKVHNNSKLEQVVEEIIQLL